MQLVYQLLCLSTLSKMPNENENERSLIQRLYFLYFHVKTFFKKNSSMWHKSTLRKHLVGK